MSKKRRPNRRIEPVAKAKVTPEQRRAAILKLLLLVLTIVVIFGFYRLMLNFRIFPFVLGAYFVALTALIIAYLIYNRGMSRKGVTEDMLPDEWSKEEKEEFIEDGKRRQKKSAWMLMLIIGFIFCFAFELLELYVFPFLEKFLG